SGSRTSIKTTSPTRPSTSEGSSSTTERRAAATRSAYEVMSSINDNGTRGPGRSGSDSAESESGPDGDDDRRLGAGAAGVTDPIGERVLAGESGGRPIGDRRPVGDDPPMSRLTDVGYPQRVAVGVGVVVEDVDLHRLLRLGAGEVVDRGRLVVASGHSDRDHGRVACGRVDTRSVLEAIGAGEAGGGGVADL